MIQIFRMLRTGASSSLNLTKINRRNFEDAPHGSTVFDDIDKDDTNAKNATVSSGNAISEQAKSGILRMSRAGARFS